MDIEKHITVRQFSEDKVKPLKFVPSLAVNHNTTFFDHIMLETGSQQEIQTIRDYLQQLKLDIKNSATGYVQDSVVMMEELTAAIKDLKTNIAKQISTVNTQAESKLLGIKAIEELIGFSMNKFLIQKGDVKSHNKIPARSSDRNSLIELDSVQEIQTVKDYLKQLKSGIRAGVTRYVQDSVSMLKELTSAVKHLKKKIEATVKKINARAESKLLAIKAIEELIGLPGPGQSNRKK